jgi:hypothetical protein
MRVVRPRMEEATDQDDWGCSGGSSSSGGRWSVESSEAVRCEARREGSMRDRGAEGPSEAEGSMIAGLRPVEKGGRDSSSSSLFSLSKVRSLLCDSSDGDEGGESSSARDLLGDFVISFKFRISLGVRDLWVATDMPDSSCMCVYPL